MKKNPEILVIASALDIRREMSMSWKWWSLLKSMWEEGAKLTVIPFEGKSVETPWWHSEPRAELQAAFWRRYFTADQPRKDNWASLLQRSLQNKPNTAAVIYLGVPLAFFGAVAREIRERTGITQIYVDGEAAEHLNRLEADSAHLESFDHVMTTQPGHEKIYLGMGAKKAHLFPWWSDPGLYKRVNSAGADFDLMAWGQAEEAIQPQWAQTLVFDTLNRHDKWNPASVGGGYVWPRELEPRLSRLAQPAASELPSFAANAYVHVCPVESAEGEIDSLALGRMIDLVCMGGCVLTHPFKGLNDLFRNGEEILVASTQEEAKKLADRARRVASWRTFLGAAGRRRVIKQHNSQARAHTLLRLV